MDAELKKFEEELERLSPESLPEGLITRMEAAMEGWEDESGDDEGNVVPFPNRDEEEEERSGRGGGSSLWAAAAGVAILGAVAALLLTNESSKPDTTVENLRGAPEEISGVAFAPQSAKRKILSSSNDDVIIPNGAQPVRLMRLNYVDTVKFRNKDGEEVHVERPAVGYFLIPVPTD